MRKVAARQYAALVCFALVLLGPILHSHNVEAARNFPQDAMRGTLTSHEYPNYRIGNTTYRIAPGGRIINQNNLIILPVSLSGGGEIMYRLDPTGNLSVIWLLTREEAAMYPKSSVGNVPEGTSGR